MCGIYGLLVLNHNDSPDIGILKRMGDSTFHRGPDDEGQYVGEGVLLGMRR